MSLKTVHIAFICFSVLLSFGFGLWLLQMFFVNRSAMYMTGAIVSFAAGFGLIVYGVKFLKKLKNVSYL